MDCGDLSCLRDRSCSVEFDRSEEQSCRTDGPTDLGGISMLARSFASIVPVARTMIHAGIVATVYVLSDSLHKPLVPPMAPLPDGASDQTC
jgi:hypothetical protein